MKVLLSIKRLDFLEVIDTIRNALAAAIDDVNNLGIRDQIQGVIKLSQCQYVHFHEGIN
jgi:hypothetical protein